MPDALPRGRQLSLIDGAEGAGTDQEALDLPEHIAALERELRYYRRLIPVLTRGSAGPSRPSHEHGPEVDTLARWLTDGTRMIGSLSRVAEQRQLELRLEAIERAHQQLRDEVAQLFADDLDEPEHDADPSLLHSGWVRAGLVALIVVLVAILSVPYLIDWWQAATLRQG